MTQYTCYNGSTETNSLWAADQKVYRVYKGNQLVWREREYYSGQVIFEKNTKGGRILDVLYDGIYQITCVGCGGKAAVTSIYDDRGYIATGGSGAAFIGEVELTKKRYYIRIREDYSLVTDNIIPNTGLPYQYVIASPGGGNATALLTPGVGGDTPLQGSVFSNITLNSAGNSGTYGTGGKGSSIPPLFLDRTLSVYDPTSTQNETFTSLSEGYVYTVNVHCGAGSGGGGQCSEYGRASFIVPPIPGYVKIVYLRDNR